MPAPAYLAELLAQQFDLTGALQLAPPGKPFKLASGKESEYYIDCRKVLLSSTGAKVVSTVMQYEIADWLQRQFPDYSEVYIGATGIGGALLLGAIMGHALLHPYWYGFVLRERQKEHGLQLQLEGHIKNGNPVVLVEDVVTSGGSIEKLLDHIDANGHPPGAVFALVDREEGGAEMLYTKHGIMLYSAIKANRLVQLIKRRHEMLAEVSASTL